MRSVSQAWGSLNASRNRERRFYFRVITTPGDETGDVYIRSHDDIDISTTGSILLARPKSHPKVRTQNLNPDEGRSTIGTMTFDAIDVSSTLTGRLRLDLHVNDVGWRNKRVEYYSGFKQLAAADYELEDTQLIDRVTYSRAVYQFRCRDVQREARKRIFEPVVMRLAQPLDATSTTIEIAASSGLEAVEHGTSYSDAPSATVAYVKIDEEIIRVPASGIQASQLTNCVRGVLGTRAAAHTTDEGASSARGKEVTEVIYLELPVPKLVYALLTGVLIGQSGTLPDHWHLGIDASDFVRLSEFQNIGDDLYVQSDDTLGMIERYILTDSEDGKTFLEKEILRKYGLFMPIHANGEIGLKRGQSVLSGSAVVGVIDDSMIVDEVTIAYAMDKIINEIRIGWNEINGEPSRFLEIIDQESVTKWEAAPRLEVITRGLVGSRQTDSRVRDIFEGLRDRYSGPPIITDVTVHSSQSLYEVGDVVRVRTTSVRDFTTLLVTTLDRAFEIQGVSKNLSEGTVTYSLFGSSQAAGPLPPIETTTALDDAFYVSGTDIAGMSGVVDTGTELELPNGITFTGASTVAGAVYYATKDVRLPSGRTANYTQNVQLRIRGVLQIDGEFNGVGAGIAGVTDTVDTSSIPAFGSPEGPISFATQAGTPGYFGTTQAGGALIERVRQRGGSSSKYRVRLQSIPATITQGRVEAIPSLNLIYNGSSISGIPSDLRGTSGGPGGLRYWNDNDPNPDFIQINRGGDGGAGGAGLLIICRGMVFGASGRIDSSGGDGDPGVRNAADERPAWSSGGAGGAPGATIILLDGATSASPVLTSGTIIADYGDTPGPGDPHNVMPDSFFEHKETRFGPPTITGAFVENDRASFFTSATSGREAGIAAARFFFLLPPVTPEEDTDDIGLAESQGIALGVTEAFAERVDPKVTTLLATVTENVTTAAYSHANIYVRGDSAGAQYRGAWTLFGPAEPSLRFELPADGETYIVRAVPVLINGVESPSGIEQTRVVSSPGLGFPVGNLSLKINFQADGATPQAGEAVLAGLKGDGTPDYTKDGSTLWDGALVAVPRQFGGTEAFTIATNVAGKKGFICFDTALTNPFTVNAVAGSVAFVYKQAATWYYDNNSAAVSFTPTSAMVALGWLETGSADTIVAGGLFVSPIQLTLTPEPSATKNDVSSGTATPTGGAAGDMYYETDAEQWWSNIAGTWTKVSDRTAARALDIIHTGPTAPSSPATGWLWSDTSVSPNVLKRYNGSTWVTVATLNTGALADKNTVGQLEIDNFSVARVSFASNSFPFFTDISAGFTTAETVDIILPPDVSQSSVLIEVQASVFMSLATSSTLSGNIVTVIRLLDDDNNVVDQSQAPGHWVPDNVNEASVTARVGMYSFTYVVSVPPANLNANETNTFKFQAREEVVGEMDTAFIRDVRMRATLLNRSI